MKTNFSISDDRLSVLKNGETIYESPFQNSYEGTLNTGIMLPCEKYVGTSKLDLDGTVGGYWRAPLTRIVVGGGSCCFGHLIALTDEGKITKVIGVDFNIHKIDPVVFRVLAWDKRTVLTVGLLVSGYGCAGNGTRLVRFHAPTPTCTPVMATSDERDVGMCRCYDIQTQVTLLRIQGVDVDEERTNHVAAACVSFR